MRITCPNCLAQYEIDGTLLPPEGREVQCSACDTIWFQAAPNQKGTNPALRAGYKLALETTEPDLDIDDFPDEAPPADAEAAPVINQPEPAPPDATRPRARSLDRTVSEVLRQEAEFEAAQRKRDANPVEMQPDLGLLGGSPWPAFRDPDNGDTDSPASVNTGTTSSFPDIDDVSATLDPITASRQSEDGGYDLPLTAKDRQRSFLQGFIVPVALGGLLVGLYLAAPLLSVLIPPASPILMGYVGAIDSGRAALAQLIFGR